MPKVYVISTAGAIVLTKFFDCLSTQLKMQHPGQESNPLPRIFMNRYGKEKVIWSLFALVVAVVVLYLWLLLRLFPYPLLQWGFVLVGSLVAAVQAAVAISNFTGRGNYISLRMERTFSFLHRRFGRNPIKKN